MLREQKLYFVLHVSLTSTAALCMASFSLTPSNTAVTTNSSVSMNCSVGNTTNFICWVALNNDGSRRPVKSCSPETISSVHINSAQMSDAGRYGCLNAGSVKTASAELIVIGIVTCENNLTSVQNTIRVNELFTFKCVISYTGNWVPSMNCSQIFTTSQLTFQHSLLLVNDTYSTDTAQPGVTYQSTVLATSSFNNSYTECRVYFDIAKKPNKTTAMNVPEINIVWKSEEIAVIPDGDTNYITYKTMILMALPALCVLAIIVLVSAVKKRRATYTLIITRYTPCDAFKGDRKANLTAMAPTSESLIFKDTTIMSAAPRSQSPRYATETLMTSSGFVDGRCLYLNVRGVVPTAQRDSAATGQEYNDVVDQNIYCEIEITPSPSNQQMQLVGRDYSGSYEKTEKAMQLEPSSIYAGINTSTYYNTEDEDDEISTEQQQQQTDREYFYENIRNAEDDR